ncbi:MAG: ATP-binding protein [Acidobacteriota bacterium]
MSTADFGQIFELAHDAILILDLADERVLDVNRRACEIYGFEHDDFVGRSMLELTVDPAGGADHVRRTLESEGRYSFETTQRHQDGGQMILEIHASVVEYGGRQAILSINRDITRRRQEEAELAQHREELEALVQDRTERLEAKIRELEHFTYTVSHDLRSPLTTISGFMGLLERDAAAGNTERMQHDMDRIRSAVALMAGLLDDLLRVSRAGKVLDEQQEVALGQPAKQAVLLATARFAEPRVDVVIDPDLPIIHCDPGRLQQVFQNLVENAVKYMGDQAQPKIHIASRRQGDETVVFVEDNGMGIDPEDHGRIFDLFERLDNEQSNGSGVGLAVVQRIIEAHSGRVWVESEGRGRGSTFCFVLPQGEALVS